jgi:hypothetical protein
MSAVSAVTSGLQAAFRLAYGRADGAVLVLDDQETIKRSFWAIALCMPSVLCRLLMTWAQDGIPQNPAHLVGRELLIFVLGWLIFVDITHRMAPLLGRTARWGRFIAMWNWCNVIEGLLVVIGGLPGLMGAPPVIDQASILITIGWALWLEWYAIRLAYNVSALTATGLVLLDQSIGVLLASIAMIISP